MLNSSCVLLFLRTRPCVPKKRATCSACCGDCATRIWSCPRSAGRRTDDLRSWPTRRGVRGPSAAGERLAAGRARPCMVCNVWGFYLSASTLKSELSNTWDYYEHCQDATRPDVCESEIHLNFFATSKFSPVRFSILLEAAI